MELTFLRFHEELVLIEFLQHHANVLGVLVLVLWVAKYVIQVHKNKDIQKVSENVID